MQFCSLYFIILLFKIITATYNEGIWAIENQHPSFEENIQPMNLLVTDDNNKNIIAKLLKDLEYSSDNHEEFQLKKRLVYPAQSKFKSQYCLYTFANRRLCRFNHLQ